LPSVPRPPFGRPPQVREQVAKTHASSTLALADTFQLPAISYPQILRDALRANVLQVPRASVPHRSDRVKMPPPLS